MYGKNRMLRAFSWMLAALMLFGNLYLPSGVFAARAAENSTTIFSDNFNSATVDTTPANWVYDANAAVKIADLDGNKVLAVSSSDHAANYSIRLPLGQAYEKLTVSYKFMKSDVDTANFLPAPSKGGGEQSVTLVANLWNTSHYTINGSNWPDLATESGNLGKFTANTWYDIKIIYDATSDEKVQAYVNGVLTNALVRTATDTVDSIKMMIFKHGSGHAPCYIDDLIVTNEGIPVVNDIAYMDFEDNSDLSGWKNIAEGGNVAIQEVNGNKVLALSRAGSGNMQPIYELSQEYNKITMSYSFCMTDNTGSYILPTLMTAGWARAAEISAGFAEAKKLSYQDSTGWHPLQEKENDDADLSPMAALEANRWYTVKIVVDNDAVTPVSVYVDGKLTNAGRFSAGAVKNIWARINADKTLYIDNLKLTVNDHEPVAVVEQADDIAYMDFESAEPGTKPTGWSVTNSETQSMTVQTVRGNKVSVLKNAGTDSNLQPVYSLGKAFGKITMSYSFQLTDSSAAVYLPTLTALNGDAVVKFGTVWGNKKIIYTSDSSNWTELKTKADANAEFVAVGALEAGQWYTVKIVVDHANTQTPVQVYFNGKLTNIQMHSASEPDRIWMRMDKNSGDKNLYIDNLKLTVNDHEPVAVAEPLQELFNDDFSTWDVGTTPVGWNSTDTSVTVQVAEKDGNKVLKVSGGTTASNVAVTKSLGGSYEKVTVSYKFMKADKKTAHFLPAPSKGGGEQSASVVANLWGAAKYTLDGGSWTDLTTASGNVGVFNANEWYEVKIIYDATKDEKIRFYVNGELTNTLVRTATDTVDTLKMYVGKFDNNFTDFYLDDLTIVEEGIDEIVYMDFEDTANGTAPAGWALNSSTNATLAVQEVRGNRVMVINHTGTSGNVQPYFALGNTYEKLTLSYSFCMPDNTGGYYLLTPATPSWGVKTNFGTVWNDKKIRWDDGSWSEVQVKGEGNSEFAKFGALEANRWYTVKIVVDTANTAAPVQVYLDGQLTDVLQKTEGAVNMLWARINAGNKPLYIDNVLVTEKDHDPIPVVEIPNDILNMDFEDVTLGTNGRGQAEGWTNSDPANANMFVQDIRGNKVLAMNNNSIDGHTHITYNLPRAYEKATLSYSFMMTKEGVASGLFYLPSTGTRGNGDQNVTVGTNSGYYNLAYTLNGGTWVQIQLKNEQTGEFENFAGWEADRWYTVKIVQDLSNTEAPIQVYLDGKLTNAQPRLTNAFDMIRIVLPKYGYGNILYLDNIVATVEDHTPVAPTEPGAVEAVPTAISLPAAYNLPVGGHLYLDLAVTPADLVLPEFTYTSSNSAVVTVDEYGEILALKEGSAVITVTSVADPTVSAATTVTVAAAGVMDTIYVAPNGKADAAGTQADPVNLQGALALIAAKNDNMTGNIEVILADGYYRLEDTLEITDAHSGTNNYTVVWKAAEGATPGIATLVVTGTI